MTAELQLKDNSLEIPGRLAKQKRGLFFGVIAVWGAVGKVGKKNKGKLITIQTSLTVLKAITYLAF